MPNTGDTDSITHLPSFYTDLTVCLMTFTVIWTKPSSINNWTPLDVTGGLNSSKTEFDMISAIAPYTITESELN